MGRPNLIRLGLERWSHLRVQQKVWAILLVAFLPLVVALAVHVTLITRLLAVQHERHQIVLAREQIHQLRGLAVDTEDAVIGYLLTGQVTFLDTLRATEAQLEPALHRSVAMVKTVERLEGLETEVRHAGARLAAMIEAQHRLIRQGRADGDDALLRYVRSSQGLTLSEALRREFRVVEDRFGQERERLMGLEEALARRAFWGLSLAVAGTLVLGVLGGRLLTRSITGPLVLLRGSVAGLGEGMERAGQALGTPQIAIHSSDEIGQLARAYEEMARRIHQQVRELEAINEAGHEINTLGPDGLDGVLRRITNRAADLLHVDVCLIMLRNEPMGCWVVEAASGEWNDRLHQSVMLWEEFPVSVQAFETRQPAIGENLRQDARPEVVRRNLIGESMLSIPLLSQGASFGVLVLLQDHKVRADEWNVRLATGFADDVAIAIANARLYDALYRKEKGLESRLRRLEHLAETLAHDLKAPGERMEGLASVLLAEYGGSLDERGSRWLRMIEQNGKELIERVHNILEVARVGARPEAVEAVDPAWVIHGVLKARAGEIEQARVRVEVEAGLPLVACHRAYLGQVFDNLISNAIKFTAERRDPIVRIGARRMEDRIHFWVSDNGPGVPAQHRERVFEPFVRLNPAATKGSGIGLAIVRRVVELYDGRVWIAPQEEGCTVWFTLPALGELTRNRPDSASTPVAEGQDTGGLLGNGSASAAVSRPSANRSEHDASHG